MSGSTLVPNLGQTAKRIKEITAIAAPLRRAHRAVFSIPEENIRIPLNIAPGVFDPAKGRASIMKTVGSSPCFIGAGKSAGKMAKTVLSLDLPKEVSILDVGTGSGFLPILIHNQYKKLHHPPYGLSLTGIDNMPQAAMCARDNCSAHNVQCEIFQSDLFSALGSRKFDYILFNAPTAHPSLSPGCRGDGTLWDPTLRLKLRFIEQAKRALSDKPFAAIVMMVAQYLDYRPMEEPTMAAALEGFRTEILFPEADDISESGVYILRRQTGI